MSTDELDAPRIEEKHDRLTRLERKDLSVWWGTRIRVRHGNVEAKKRQCWGVLCSLRAAKENAQLIIKRSRNQN